MMETDLDVRQWVTDAERRCRPWVVKTPLEFSPWLSELTGGEVWLKLESMQRTWSFKFRGAVNRVMALSDEELERGVVTASTGNHAAAMIEAMRLRGASPTIYVGENVDPMRLALLRRLEANVVVSGQGAGEAERNARRAAGEQGQLYVSPYNDPGVIGGQGTCAFEFREQLPDIDCAVISVGGGGLISGCAGWLKGCDESIEVVGVLPANSPVMLESLKAGKPVDLDIQPTLADTCSGNVDLDTVTFELCRRYVDDMVAISEEEIEDGIRSLFEQHRLIVEGSAALPVALMKRNPERFAGRKTVALICGRNIDTDLFRRIVCMGSE